MSQTRPEAPAAGSAGEPVRACSLGVLGHVDHGKTALVRALTGIETDRLAEERERGLSIVLGFSYLETGHGIVDLIDVPGHEDFIRTMISGATGLDGVVLVVAANEGVMPQTREHLEIASLLRVPRGVAVLTKTDLVDARELERATTGLHEFLRGTFLENAPIVPVSAARGQGLEALAREIDALAAVAPARGPDRGSYLPLDRAFTKHGFGVIGTGTLRGGVLRVGDALEVLPAGLRATVRALQSRSRPVAAAAPGQRVAVNLRGVGLADVRRGDTLAAPGLLRPTRRVDARLELLAAAARPLRNGASVRLLLGTTEVEARIRLLDAAEVAPGAAGFAQLRLARPIATQVGERFIVRSFSPSRTIGGGGILDVDAERHRRFDAVTLERLAAISGGDPLTIAVRLLEEAGADGIDSATLRSRSGLEAEPVAGLAESLDAVVVDATAGEGGRLVARRSYVELGDAIVAAVERHHAEQPESAGLAAGSLRSGLTPVPDEAVFRWALRELLETGRLERRGEQIARAGFDPLAGLDARTRALTEHIEAAWLDGGLEAPNLDKLVGPRAERRRAFRLLLETGRLVRLRTYDRGTALVLHVRTLERVRLELERRFPYPARFAVKDARDLLRSTRRHVVPVLEHFDATGVTVRLGDLRQLRLESRR